MIPARLGANLTASGVEFAVFSGNTTRIELCLFTEDGEHELRRLPMTRDPDGIWHITIDNAHAGTRYGYRAHGEYAPEIGLWYDPSKLLVDPYAITLDRPFDYDPQLSVFGIDTASMVPKAIVTACRPVATHPPHFTKGGLIYEVNVRALTMLHPGIPQELRGTVRALAHPVIIAHLKNIGVTTVELMPVTAWINERHLPPLKLSNSWGYNPVALMALDPRLCPGGMNDLAETVSALHAHDIGVVLDLVFNHTGESDQVGPTISMRGLDSLAYYRHPLGHPGLLINDTGCGNTLACDHPVVGDLVLDTLRHFVVHAGVDGFRFDLAPIIGRDNHGFSPEAALLQSIQNDPLLTDRVLIAEPWDIGYGGYQLGNFPEKFLEWNDWARDAARMFWRGDGRKIGDLATALAGSSHIFARNGATATRSVNFIAAHDGFSLLDLVSFQQKNNELNGEQNRDGHNENYSWNNGVEGETSDLVIQKTRIRDVKALLATLFVMRGPIMLMAGDELGRSQKGNNNAYAQDNELTWLDWQHADISLIEYVAALATIRGRFSVFADTLFFTGAEDVTWLNAEGEPMQIHDWDEPSNGLLTMVLRTTDCESGQPARLAIAFNRTSQSRRFYLPGGTKNWKPLLGNGMSVDARSVSIFVGSRD